MKRLMIAIAITALTAPLFGGLSKFKDWDRSPQGSFMTKAEREQWAAIQSDAEAQTFVDRFLASRGGSEFAAEVANRAEMADKYLTVGKTQGSKTLRGKAIILFGPPSSLDVTDEANTRAARDNPAVSAAMTGGTGFGDSSGGAKDDSGPASYGSTLLTAHKVRVYHMSFDAVPGGKVDVTFEADPGTGKDRVRGNTRNLEAAFERAASASIKAK